MSSQLDRNKALVTRYFKEVVQGGNLDLIDDLLSEDFYDHHHSASGRDHIVDSVKAFHSASPDLEIVINDLIAEDDKVWAYITSRGTAEGQFFFIPPTHKPFAFDQVHIYRIANDKMIEHWAVSDDLKLLQQAGLVPERPGAAPAGS